MNTMREPPSALRASAISERMPPSPLLSMRSRIATYLTVTIRNERPEDQRDGADHLLGQQDAVGAGRDQRLAEGVERARADIAVDDPDGADQQRPEAGMAVASRPSRGHRASRRAPAPASVPGCRRRSKPGLGRARRRALRARAGLLRRVRRFGSCGCRKLGRGRRFAVRLRGQSGPGRKREDSAEPRGPATGPTFHGIVPRCYHGRAQAETVCICEERGAGSRRFRPRPSRRPVIPGPRSGARDPEPPTRSDFAPQAVLLSGLACGAPKTVRETGPPVEGDPPRASLGGGARPGLAESALDVVDHDRLEILGQRRRRAASSPSCRR